MLLLTVEKVVRGWIGGVATRSTAFNRTSWQGLSHGQSVMRMESVSTQKVVFVIDSRASCRIARRKKSEVGIAVFYHLIPGMGSPSSTSIE